jgi:GNAT superfamily N-acetyltransferase
MFGRLATLTGELRGQLAASAGLRLGLLAIIALVWVYGLLLVSDGVAGRRKDLAALTEQAERLQPLLRDDHQWPMRADEVRRQLAAMQAMVWAESDLGLTEAAFQDWIRATASRSGLSLRGLTMARAEAVLPAAAHPASAGDGVGPQLVKARLLADFDRVALMGFLSEAARNERAVVVDRLLVRTWTQPPTAEIDLRILARARAATAQ